MRRRGGRPRIAEDALLDDLRRVAEQLGEPPTAVQMDKHGDYSVGTYQNRFGRWNRALREAGFDTSRH